MSPHVVVIGGGFAGLRAAVGLADAGIRVTLVESRAGLGGRARSFEDPASGEVIDNGQHLFLAGYRQTIQFLTRLGTAERLVFQDRLRVSFVRPGGKRSLLSCPAAPSPWHLLVGLMRMSGFSVSDKLGLWRIYRSIRNTSAVRGELVEPRTESSFDKPVLSGVEALRMTGDLDDLTVEEWLTQMGQSERSRETFWRPLAIATLNEDPAKASALGLVSVLKTLLFAPWSHARLGLPAVGLSQLYADAAQRILQEQRGTVLLNSPVDRFEVEESRVSAVVLANGERLRAHAFVSAVPPQVLCRLLPASLIEGTAAFRSLKEFRTSPIVSMNLWLDQVITEDGFVGFTGTRIVQWLFRKPTHVSIILSAAHGLIDRPNPELVEAALADLKDCFPGAREAKLLRSQVVREREATVSLTVGTQRLRPGPRTCLSNLFLAGDWTATGLPATIESAVASGHTAANTVLKWLQSPLDSMV